MEETASSSSSSNTKEGEKNEERGDYGPVRTYTIKYDDDGMEQQVPEHFVFPKKDYLLSTTKRGDGGCDDIVGWKGVRNFLDENSEDLWARCVGWYAVVDNIVDGHTTDDKGGRTEMIIDGEDDDKEEEEIRPTELGREEGDAAPTSAAQGSVQRVGLGGCNVRLIIYLILFFSIL